jgi:serine O-acetyltransferase
MGNKTYKNEDELKSIVRSLATNVDAKQMCHMRFGSEPLPQQGAIKQIIMLCRGLLFPGFFGNEDVNSYNLEYNIGIKCEQFKSLLENQIVAGLAFVERCTDDDLKSLHSRAVEITAQFIGELPKLRKILHTDVEAIYVGDPAATSCAEVIYCYPAIKAIINYRIAHELFVAGVPVIPRMITEMAHSETGIDIHPGAVIGGHFAIDHGTGVVIGATAIIGHNVKLYQGVTLGARSFDLDDNGNPVKGIPRHPVIGDNVIIYSNASLLGRIHIGNNVVIGGNIWVTTDVADGERLIQAKANNIVRLKNDE